MNTNTIAQVIAQINASKIAIKQLAVAARVAAPKGEKMAHGQHASAIASAKIADATERELIAAGWVKASVTVNKAGTDVAVHYRAPQTLAQRVETYKNAAAKAKAQREAKKAAKAPAAVAAPAPATDLAAQLAAMLKAA